MNMNQIKSRPDLIPKKPLQPKMTDKLMEYDPPCILRPHDIHPNEIQGPAPERALGIFRSFKRKIGGLSTAIKSG
jgi:hypothetical protein